MSDVIKGNGHTVFRIVLTGGPCGGKTTGQARLSSFFESLGWKVYRVPETATILLGGGVKFMDMDDEEVFNFQKNLIETMMHVEKTFFDLADSCSTNCIVICDRGVMDATAYMSPEQWQRMKTVCDWNEVDLRDNRYHSVVHLVSAAKGAEAFYTTQDHAVRHEGLAHAKTLDELTSQAWVGHPYFHVVDNSTDFERKLMKMISNVCNRFGIEAEDRLAPDTRKRKYLIQSLPDDSAFPVFRDFIVIHDYLVTPLLRQQARLRKRGEKVQWLEDQNKWDSQSGHWTFTHTIRKPEINGQSPEVRMAITHREYEILVAQRDTSHYTIYKRRRCFLWNTQYFQMDIYLQPCHPRCRDLILLETYTNSRGDIELPPFLNVIKEVTLEPYYSMFNLSSVDQQQQISSSAKVKPADATSYADMKNGPMPSPDVTLTARPSNPSVEDSAPDSLK